jgi:hypothetical protein
LVLLRRDVAVRVWQVVADKNLHGREEHEKHRRTAKRLGPKAHHPLSCHIRSCTTCLPPDMASGNSYAVTMFRWNSKMPLRNKCHRLWTLARLVPMAGRHSEKSFAGNSMLSTLSAENFSMPARGGPRGNGKVFLLISTIRPQKLTDKCQKSRAHPSLSCKCTSSVESFRL